MEFLPEGYVMIIQRSIHGFAISVSAAALAAVDLAHAVDVSAGGVEFFESRVRPLFAQHCYSCHSEAEGKVKAGLQLDWKGGWEKGGESGPALIPGSPEKSLLMKAVSYSDPDLQMPPKGKRLSSEEVEDLRKWIAMGAPDTRSAPSTLATGKGGMNPRKHWAFQPVVTPSVPAVRETAWLANPVDAFILTTLEENGLSHAATADRRTLIRRVYFDLIGLAPTPEEVDAFVADTSVDSYEKLVDRLLASPHYGERWGRHWLDVARYSDTKGQIKQQRETSVYPYAWTYRDYVINALNQDLPYDQFIREQLAADRLPRDKGGSQLAALGFLTVGERFNGNENDIINDRIDVVSKAFLGLTVSCARCHDHRFDPIPQADYYSWHGIFSSSVEPTAKPLIGSLDTETPAYRDYLQQKAEIEARMKETKQSLINTAFGDYQRMAAVYLFATTLPAKEAEAYLSKNGGDPALLPNWQRLIRAGQRREFAIFRLWGAASRIPQQRFPEQIRRLLANLGKDERSQNLPPQVMEIFRGQAPKGFGEFAAIYGRLFSSPDVAWQNEVVRFLSDVALNVVPNRQRIRLGALREQYDRLDMTHAGAPARAMALYDSTAPKDSAILIRGEASNPGATVPRRQLEILASGGRPAYTQGSGRLQLAQSIASASSPLTARVLVNRVWLHHFGEGLVTTPDDFGTQSAPPSHPALLDWLSATFMKEGWSIKKLHRLILTSNTYRQSSEPNPANAAKDPANRWLSHAPIRRLEFEPLRDSILQMGGGLDLAVGGKPVDLSEGTRRSERKGLARLEKMGMVPKLSTAERRTIYGYVDREDLIEVLTTFDFANPSICSGRRYETTVPQQALFLMNSPLVVEQARRVVERSDFVALSSDEDRIRALYRLLFQRLPSAEEVRMGSVFLENWTPAQPEAVRPVSAAGPLKQRLKDRRPEAVQPQPKSLSKWAEYTHALLMVSEMSFVR